jgi:beta-glucanase (GH16 family)
VYGSAYYLKTCDIIYENRSNANVGWQNPSGSTRWKSVFTPLAEFHNPEWSSQFHLWVMHWEPGFIRLYLDGRLMNHVDLRQTVEKKYDQFNPFHQKAYMILNLAVGGMGGNPAHTAFPGIFQVQYVRVYQRAN